MRHSLLPLMIPFLFVPLACSAPQDARLPADTRAARSYGGMVSSATEEATDAGLEVLRSGGNAVDAAVAVAFALAVTLPQAGNLGGGGFMVIRTADGRATTIDFRETAPAAARRDMYLDSAGTFLPDRSQLGALAAGVFPGAAMHTPVDVTDKAVARAAELQALPVDCIAGAQRPDHQGKPAGAQEKQQRHAEQLGHGHARMREGKEKLGQRGLHRPHRHVQCQDDPEARMGAREGDKAGGKIGVQHHDNAKQRCAVHEKLVAVHP